MAKFINEKVTSDVGQMISNHLIRNINQMDEAFAGSDDEDGNTLTVSIGVKFEAKNGKIKTKTIFSFTKEKIKEEDERWIDPNQRELFEK